MAETYTQAETQPLMTPPQPGEPCEECAAPLAADQRYCLNCGHRRGGPRVNYRHYTAAAAPQSEAPPAQPAENGSPGGGDEEPAKPQRDYAPLAAVGGIAVLGLMLLIGVLIGRGDGGGDSAAAPPVIRIPAAGGAAEAAPGDVSRNTGGNAGGATQKKANGGGEGGGALNTGDATTASDGELEELGNTSGEDYVKQSENLPNKIATPGAPPPIDKSKPPGGGEGGGEVIK